MYASEAESSIDILNAKLSNPARLQNRVRKFPFSLYLHTCEATLINTIKRSTVVSIRGLALITGGVGGCRHRPDTQYATSPDADRLRVTH